VPELPLRLETIVSAPFGENTYIAWLPGRKDCLVIDPGLQPDDVIEVIERQGLEPAAILNTHGHSDHIAGNAAVKERWPACPLVIGTGDAPKLTDSRLNLSAPFGFNLISPEADVLVNEGDSYSAAGFDLEVHEVPGHSIGHVVFVWKGGEPQVVFGGDVLFAGSVGRTDFPDGDFEQLAAGIRKHLFVLPDSTIVLTGHGPATTVGKEKRTNPFVGEHKKP
jgi:hydroxyacylglutathione hydrolase